MALGVMTYTHETVGGGVEILYNSAYVGRAVTLDAAAFTNGVCKAGTPIGADGTIKNTADAIGILLWDVPANRPQGTVVIGGYIKKAVAQAHSGVTYADALIGALTNVVFC